MENNKIPPRYDDADVKKMPETLKTAFRNMFTVAGKTNGLYIFGGVGVGKTYSMYAMFKHLRKTSRAVFWNTSELLKVIRNDFDLRPQDKTREDEYLMTFRETLFLDDLGSERVTDFALDTLYLIINARYNSKLPTIISSNYNLDELGNRIGDRIASRICELCELYEYTGEDRRLK